MIVKSVQRRGQKIISDGKTILATLPKKMGKIKLSYDKSLLDNITIL